MARFDVYEYNPAHTPYVLDVQADILEHLHTRIVVPLLPLSKANREEYPLLKPVISFKKRNFVLMTSDMGSIHVSSLGKKAGNLHDNHYTIVDAIDFLLQGF